MTLIMSKEHESVEKSLRTFEFMWRKTKTGLSSLPSDDFPIQHYNDPKNSSMPKSEEKSKITPLYVLAKAAFSLSQQL